MERSRYNDFVKLLEKTSKVYGRSFSPDVLDLWVECLLPYAFEEVKEALNRFVQTESRMPVPADILKSLRGTNQDRALSALVKVEKAMRTHGAYATVVFDDPGIHVAITGLGGWIRLCGLSEAEMVWWRKDFRERYEHWVRTGAPIDDIPPFLPGLFELGNMETGECPPPPVRIGDREKCRLIETEAGNRESARVRSLVVEAMKQGALKEIPR